MVAIAQQTVTMGFRSGSASENDIDPRKNELHQRFRQARHMFREDGAIEGHDLRNGRRESRSSRIALCINRGIRRRRSFADSGDFRWPAQHVRSPGDDHH
jgi:hypothetical protein